MKCGAMLERFCACPTNLSTGIAPSSPAIVAVEEELSGRLKMKEISENLFPSFLTIFVMDSIFPYIVSMMRRVQVLL